MAEFHLFAGPGHWTEWEKLIAQFEAPRPAVGSVPHHFSSDEADETYSTSDAEAWNYEDDDDVQEEGKDKHEATVGQLEQDLEKAVISYSGSPNGGTSVLPAAEEQPPPKSPDFGPVRERKPSRPRAPSVPLSPMTAPWLVAPKNFNMVCPGVYRSGFPTEINIGFLHKCQLKSIINLCTEEDYPPTMLEYVRRDGIQLFRCGIEGTKDVPLDVLMTTANTVNRHLLNRANYPILIHCNKGKHRTGVVIGTFRKFSRWSLASIFDEYRRFAGQKVRFFDLEFIEVFEPDMLALQPPQPDAQSATNT